MATISLMPNNSPEVDVIRIEGRLTLGEGANDLHKLFNKELENGKRRFVLDMSACLYIDSAGIGTIVNAFMKAERNGGKLGIANPGKGVREAFKNTRLDEILHVYDSVDAALAET